MTSVLLAKDNNEGGGNVMQASSTSRHNLPQFDWVHNWSILWTSSFVWLTFWFPGLLEGKTTDKIKKQLDENYVATMLVIVAAPKSVKNLENYFPPSSQSQSNITHNIGSFKLGINAIILRKNVIQSLLWNVCILRSAERRIGSCQISCSLSGEV